MEPSNKTQVFVLVAVKGKLHQSVREGTAQFVQGQRTILRGSGNWTGWTLQVRTKEGYKAIPILPADHSKDQV